jgi:asparagine synthetase B (glutamine-hydrolysing)
VHCVCANRYKALGYVRLAINGLSSSGEQPLNSSGASVHGVVNGELYEADVARERLKQCKWQGSRPDDEQVAPSSHGTIRLVKGFPLERYPHGFR